MTLSTTLAETLSEGKARDHGERSGVCSRTSETYLATFSTARHVCKFEVFVNGLR